MANNQLSPKQKLHKLNHTLEYIEKMGYEVKQLELETGIRIMNKLQEVLNDLVGEPTNDIME